ncbi:DUF4355 domain-containing protein [Clostridium sp. MB40-C1]|uniref:capsid assembly scaffolding protein Gp46 family protein n=1 Tax=Clostridium sp. MB40-C1 TaxID=3070996 RepID=UPI0027DF9A6E|nr:DUF4355 domain-containing protein [Clostridium sp. MB40-C1]WMJ81246.1 DUF4355 domain-containing protein [Clostridium sp. MB40-C1]
MAWKENISQEEYNTDIESVKSEAVKGLFTQEQLDTEIGKTKELFKDYISNEDFEKTKNDYETKISELGGKEPTAEEKKILEKQKELADKEKELLDKENMYNLSDMLEERGLPKSLAEYLKFGDKEVNEKLVEGLTQIFSDERFSNSFKGVGHKKNEGITKEQFKNMSLEEQFKIFNTNPELYNKLVVRKL